jgi:hypothetical protein
MNEDGFLAEAIKLAVVNKNLILPNLKDKFRLLAVEDLVEAILRASFLSGTEGEKFLILGEETDSEAVAKILMDEAKMTRFKVREMTGLIDQGDKFLAEESRRKLRWKPEIDFDKGIKETLQYFFSKIDEENRAKKKNPKPFSNPSPDRAENVGRKERMFDVMVEDDQKWPEKEEEEKTDEQGAMDFKEIPKIVEEEDYIEEESEEFEDIPRFSLGVNNILPKDREKTIDLEIKKENNSLPFEKNKNKKNKMTLWVALALALVVLLAMPIQWVLTTVAAVNNVKKVEDLIKNKKYVKAGELAENNFKKITDIDESISDWNLNKWKLLRNYQTGLKILEDGLVLEKKTIPLVQSMDAVNGAVFGDRSINWGTELAGVENGLADLENNLGILQARLNGDYSWYSNLGYTKYFVKQI